MVIISQPMIGRGIWKGEAELWGERHRIIVEILSDGETPWDIFEAWRASLGGVSSWKRRTIHDLGEVAHQADDQAAWSSRNFGR